MQESGLTPIYNPGIGLLQTQQKRPNLPWTPVSKIQEHEDFNAPLSLEWNYLRSPKTSWHSIKKGFLKIKLRPETVEELKNPSFLARRTISHNYEAATKIHFKTKKKNEKAGLVIYRRNGNNYQLLKKKDHLVLIKVFQKDNAGEIIPEELAKIPYKESSVILHAKVEGIKVQFSYGNSLNDLKSIEQLQDYSILTDEITKKFNGVYIGMYATSSGIKSKNSAQFDWFLMK